VELQQEALTLAQELKLEDVLDILREHLEAFRNERTIVEAAP
jgi:hypothetical protein